MLYEVMKYLNNFFVPRGAVVNTGLLKVENGVLLLDGIKDGQYVLIEGSTFNNGVHQYPAFDLVDEEFDGTATGLAVPKDFLKLVAEIEAYQNTEKVTGYASESFGGYSYTKAVNSAGGMATWKDVFRGRLNVWRKI